MVTPNNLKKSNQLGMDFGTATSRLKKMVLFGLLQRLDENICFQCGNLIEDADDLSIEHKIPWLNDDPKLFWDVKNVAFSHLKCNSGKRRFTDESNKANRIVGIHLRKVGPSGTRWCTGCREFRPEIEFTKHRRYWNGLDCECKACRSRRRKTSVRSHSG